jgi:hypothetical protein
LKAADSSADPCDVLHGCWRFLEGLRDSWLAKTQDGRLGLVRQVDHTWLRLSPVGPADVMYRCQQCRRLASVSVRGVCTQCHVLQRERVFRAGAALSDEAGGVFNGE